MQIPAIAMACAFLFTGTPVAGEAQSDPGQLEQSCDAGDLDACVEIARRCAVGREGFEKDVARALLLYERACNEGHPDGCQYLGQAYQEGDIVPKDGKRAAQLFEKACEGESGYGCYLLGFSYQFGQGVARDDTRASSAYERACDFGQRSGCNYAVGLHHPLTGDLKDATRWATLMEKYCDHSDGTPCLQLGLAYDIGMWVPEDANHANELFKKGCFHGNKEACALIRQ